MPAHEWMQARGQTQELFKGLLLHNTMPIMYGNIICCSINYYSISGILLCIQLQVGSNICTARLSTKNATQVYVWTNAWKCTGGSLL